MRQHSGEKPYCCENCSAQFSNSQDLWMHKRENCNSELMCRTKKVDCVNTKSSCLICKKLFNSSYFEKHMNRHTREKTYSCHQCKKIYFFKDSLIYHMKTHAGEKPYNCQDCDKTFAFKDSLARHIRRIHSDDKTFVCCLCEEKFSENKSVLRHLKLHFRVKTRLSSKMFGSENRSSGNKQTFCSSNDLYSCVEPVDTVECDVVITRSADYSEKYTKDHEQRNDNLFAEVQESTVEHLYTCIVCSKHFVSARIFNRHLVSHNSGEKPKVRRNAKAMKFEEQRFGCGICCKAFAYREDAIDCFNEHKPIHQRSRLQPNKFWNSSSMLVQANKFETSWSNYIYCRENKRICPITSFHL